MPMTVRDIVMDADLFRRAYPGWPHSEPCGTPGESTDPAGDDPVGVEARKRADELFAMAEDPEWLGI